MVLLVFLTQLAPPADPPWPSTMLAHLLDVLPSTTVTSLRLVGVSLDETTTQALCRFVERANVISFSYNCPCFAVVATSLTAYSP